MKLYWIQRAPRMRRWSGYNCRLFISSRKYPNGYAVISISIPDNYIKMTFRTYYDNRRKFDKGTNVASDGVFYATDNSERYYLRVAAALTSEKVRVWVASTVGPHLRPTLEECSVDRPLSTIFVEPPLMRALPFDRISRDTDIIELDTKTSINEIVSQKQNSVLFVPAEYGRTSLGKAIASHAIHYTINSTDRLRIPVLIDLNDTKLYEANILRRIKDWLPDTSTLGHTSQSLVEEGMITFIFDNVRVDQIQSLESLKAFRNKYSQCQFILLLVSPFPIGAARTVKVHDNEDLVRVEVRALTRGDVRRLVENWMLDGSNDLSLVVEQMVARFGLLSIPLSAVNVAILLTVIESSRGFAPINTSSLIENYIDVVLEKYDLKTLFRGNFDYRDKVDYLAHIARYMVDNNIYRLEYDLLHEISSSYFRQKWLPQRADNIIQYFIGAKIFETVSDAVQFRLNIFQSYFIAHSMTLDEAFKRKIVERYASFTDELDIYCGIKRDDVGVLNALASEYEKAGKALFQELPDIPNVADLDLFNLQTDKTTSAMLKRITNDAFSKRLPQQKKDSILQQSLPAKNDDTQQKLSRPQIQNDLVRWVMALRAYSHALKNLEFIDGSQKQEHLTAILKGWSQGLVFAIFFLRLLIEGSDIDVAGTKIKGFQLKEDDTLALKFLFLILPTLVTYYLRNDLGTDKLQLALRSIGEGQPTSINFMIASLLMDLRSSDYQSVAKVFIKSVRKSRYWTESMMIKLRDFYLRNSFQEDEENAVRRMVGDLLEGSQAPSGRMTTGEKQAVTQKLLGLRRKKIVRKIQTALSENLVSKE
jgi:hypothetical protein